MPDNDPQRFWNLERDVQALVEKVGRLEGVIDSNDSRASVREELRTLKRDLETLAKDLERLKNSGTLGATKEDVRGVLDEIRGLKGRLEVIERNDVKTEGVSLGRRWVWAVVLGALGFVGGVLGVLLQVLSALRQLGGGV